MNFCQELVGLFGKPVSENPAQVMVEAAFAAGKLFWRYLTIEVDPAHLGDAVKGARAMGFRIFLQCPAALHLAGTGSIFRR